MITNIRSQSRSGAIAGSLVDSSITNVVNYHPDVKERRFESGGRM